MPEELNKAIYDLGTLIEQMTAGTEFSELNRQMFNCEIGRFIMFLVASSKIVTEDDLDMLNEYLLGDATMEEIQTAISADDVYVSKYAADLPLSFEMLVAFDMEYAKSPVKNERTILSRNYIDLYKSIGNEIVSSENKVHYEDRKNLAAYIEKMEKYRDKKLGDI